MKRFLQIITLLIIFIPMITKASEATCTYVHKRNTSNATSLLVEQKFTVVVNYKYGFEPTYNVTYENQGNDEIVGVYTQKSDFIDNNGNIICPNLFLVTVTKNNPDGGISLDVTYGDNLTFYSKSMKEVLNPSAIAFSYSGTLNLTVDDGKEKADIQASTATKISNSTSDSSERLNYNSICSEEGVRNAFRIIGYVIQVCRWIAPLMLIVLGMVDFGKAAIASDEKALSNATTSLIRRFIAGIAIFFIPTIILAFLNAIEVTKGIEDKDDSQFGACTKCLFDPYNECPK